MYCPSCGKEISAGLTFCNFCGVRLGPVADDPNALAASSFNMLVGAAIVIPIIGLGIIIALMAVMKEGLNIREEMIFAVVCMSFLLLLVAETGMLILLISRTRKPKAQKSSDTALLGPKSANQIDTVVMRGLNASNFDGIPSVTEHTTRTLDAVYRKSGD